MRHSYVTAWFSCFAALLTAPELTAQSWRTLTAARQAGAADSLRVRVEYGAGTLKLASAPARMLYDLTLRYDAERVEAVRRFEPGSRTLVIGTKGRGSSLTIARRKGLSELALALGTGLPLDLSLHLGAVEADLDLGGLAIDRLSVESGASDTKLRFPTPNPRRLRELEFEVGAASIRASQLGNANVEHIEVDCGVGSADLDFSGEWTGGDIDARLRVAMGSLILRIPREIGVRVKLDKFLAAFDHSGLAERDGAYYSENWDRAPRKLVISAATTFGRVRIDWID